MSVWVIARTAPTTIVRIATAQIIGRQSQRRPPKRDVEHPQQRAERGDLVQDAMNAVTGVGAPW